MSRFNKFDTSHSAVKSYATAENAHKAFLILYGQVEYTYIIVQLDAYNSTNEKLFGRFIPVAIGQAWLQYGVFNDFYVIG